MYGHQGAQLTSSDDVPQVKAPPERRLWREVRLGDTLRDLQVLQLPLLVLSPLYRQMAFRRQTSKDRESRGFVMHVGHTSPGLEVVSLALIV